MLKIAWTSEYCHPLPANHRFPMEKYELIPDQLLHEGTIASANIFHPEPLDERHILTTHDAGYWQKLRTLSLTRSEERRTGFPLSASLVRRERIIAQGTIDCALFALQYGVSMNIAGGTHHAFTNRGEGFCLLNDIALAANYLLINELASKILVVDLDVHQGNGTAEIFQITESVFTFSMHGAKNYPYQKQKSDLDIELADRTGDDEYLTILKSNLPRILNSFEPDFIFFQSGVDVLATDKLGRLGLSINGCRERDRYVLEICKTNEVPVVAVMGGGYSPEIRQIIEAHANTFREAQELFF
ncbi:histone deacetylase [Fulvivirga sedimenti]|uniref:Histone deacetylase n=1 Tax=Fulvivirga sedimenti TaxID=2879465 RepID=A0A9X1HV82_9BACT|nr:histone deacetylase [Fulvivirga sedimenti]MCA6078883.1 histone deacetylase [Fulvivirga sedimenti]